MNIGVNSDLTKVEGYCYGYQSSEKDNEIYGEGNTYTTYFRELDVRVCRWFAIDPKTSATPWESPYVSMGDNPIWYSDPMGLEVINGHKREKDNAKRKLDAANQKLAGFERGDKGYRAAKKERRQARQAYNDINDQFQRAERKIMEIKQKDRALFIQANMLTDQGGTEINIYIYDTPHEEMQVGADKDKVIFGKCDANPGADVQDSKGKKPDYTSVTSKKHGDNTITIKISTESQTIHLAHELGHGIYNAKNMKAYQEWLQAHPSEQNKRGHGIGDPSGKAATDAEKNFK